MRYVSEREMEIWETLKPWIKKDPTLETAPDEIKKLLEELRRIGRENRLRNG
ncbi:MAG: hypothetical protein PUC26_03475 [Eubacteriales bacterium]|nr:hypothetical protein [Eubacteriales bacterium]